MSECTVPNIHNIGNVKFRIDCALNKKYMKKS